MNTSLSWLTYPWLVSLLACAAFMLLNCFLSPRIKTLFARSKAGNADMVERWVASAWLLTEKHFRRIDGHADLWALAAILGREVNSTTQPSKERVA